MADERYTVISADCHGGGDIADYRPYLERRLLDEFDAWCADFANPYDDLRDADANRNWDGDRRLTELEADGVVAEVIFPNTVPPFFPKPSLVQQPPGATAGDLDLRWAGLHAHNRWLADFCAAAPGLPPLYAPDYEPLWAACEDLGLPINHHSGSAAPDYGDYPEAKVMFLLEVTWWAHRTLWHLIFAGVMERHPDLQFVLTEQGTAWLPEQLATLDYYRQRMSGEGSADGSQESIFGAEVMARLSLTPSEYFARQCHVGSSFIRRQEVPLRHAVGVHKIMWGSDFPHLEGCWPFSHEHLRMAFADVDPVEVRAMVGGNAARVYGFDLEALAPVAARVGPRVADVARPLGVDEIPDEALRCPAFAAVASQAQAQPATQARG